MNRKASWATLLSAALAVGCGQDEAPSPDTENAGQSLTFESSGGVVSMEAEHFTTNTSQGGHSWSQVSEATASDGSAVSATPDNGANNNTGYTTQSPRLNFDVDFAQAGTYQVWIRGRAGGAAAADSDSVHVGLDGQALASSDRISSFTSSFGWSRATMDGVNATLAVPSAGQHTVNVWMREDGFVLDKIVLATNAGFTPTGTGPAETPASSASCGDGSCNGDETCSSCAADCGACSDPGVTAYWLEAEDAGLSGNPTFSLQSHANASGGQGLLSPTGTSYDSPGSARATFTFDVSAGSYRVWARVIAPNADDDSFWVSMDGSAFVKWNAIPNSSSWAWDDVHNSDAGSQVVSYSLSAGTHTLVVANREDGARIDKLYVTANGDTPTGLGGSNGTCSDGVQNQGETGIDCGGPCPACPECSAGQTQPGTTACGLNGRGVLEQICVSGLWADSGTCLDPDLCVDDDTVPGTTPCGLNGRGTLDGVCVAGQWSQVCNDPDVCTDDDTQAGTTACGLNGRGALDQLCVNGGWTDTAVCSDPDVCVDLDTQPGSTACGLNGRGALDEQCVFGQWQDSTVCVDPDVCTDDDVQAGTTPCGIAGTLDQLCVVGQWLDTSTCTEPSTCSDGTQNGDETGIDCGGSCPPCEVTAVWLEAEDGVLSGSAGFAIQNDGNASQGQYLLPPTGTSYDAPGTARASYTFFASSGSYRVWARVIAPNADDDSFWVSMDGGAFVKWNSIPNTSSWAWDDVHNSDAGSQVVSYSLSAGTHTLVVANREDGARIDKLYVTADGDVPTGLGGSAGTCGDGTCDPTEDCLSCGADCGACGSCGDGTCDPDEDCASCEADCGTCPTFLSQDIGAVGAPGSLSISGDVFTVTGSGDDIHSTFDPQLDEFHFAYQQVTGDATIVARVLSVSNTNEWAKGGVMFRETLATDSKFALVFSRPDAGVQAQFRSQTGQTGTDTGNPQGGSATKWVRVERTGDQFSTYYSTDGANFTQIGSTTTISMAATIYVGLAVTSHADGQLCTAVFDDVDVQVAAFCGDGTCDAAEDCANCGVDCGACGVCGDGTCDLDETCASCQSDCGTCPPSGLDSRPPNPTCVAPAPLSSSVAITDQWPFTFTNPIQVVQPPGDETRLIVVQRAGQARSVPMGATSSGQTSTFLQLGNVVTSSNGGFLSLAFHPDWETNRYAYVVYTTNNNMKRISRFQSTNGGQSLNASTEQVVLEIQHLFEFNHNGGQIAFGKDGYLYMSSGDDAYLDYTRARQAAQTDNMFGKVLRIDVDNGSPYSIPSDNPFASGGGLPEIFAYGFRNPWRFSVDRLTGELWLADVGEDTWEEVNIVQSGGFFGWPYREGDLCFTGNPTDCATPYISPEYAYTSGAASISGGFVYRGSTLSSTYGKYVYGDYVNGQVSIYDPGTGTSQAIAGSTNGGAVAGFGEDGDGELYVVRYSSGRIQKLVPGGGGGPSDFPALLSDTGCFDPSNPTDVVAGAIPYTVAQPFWSDGVVKERYLALPDGTQIGIAPSGDWELPPGGVTIKNFRYQGQLFETRFFVRHTNGSYAAYTYEWNDQQTQATLVPPGGASRSLPGLDWNYPTRGECFACHTSAANFSLGLETRQLNVDGFYPSTGRTANQLYTLDFIGTLTGNTASMTPFPAIDDLSVPVAQRAEAYLHINCSNCHRPGGPGGGPMDARFETAFGNKNLCNEPATLGDLGLPNAVLLLPGDHMSSVAWVRMSVRDQPYAMPPLASTVVDAAGAALLQEWIDGLFGCP